MTHVTYDSRALVTHLTYKNGSYPTDQKCFICYPFPALGVLSVGGVAQW